MQGKRCVIGTKYRAIDKDMDTQRHFVLTHVMLMVDV